MEFWGVNLYKKISALAINRKLTGCELLVVELRIFGSKKVIIRQGMVAVFLDTPTVLV